MQQQPGLRVLLTHSTATGREAGAKLLREGDAQAWLPYDTPGAVRRFLHVHQPAVGVVMETEIWPNLLHGAQRAGAAHGAGQCAAVVAQRGQRPAAGGADARGAGTLRHKCWRRPRPTRVRLREAGARDVQVMGNLKFDITPKPELLARGQAWRGSAGRGPWCWPLSRGKAKKAAAGRLGCVAHAAPAAAHRAAPPAAF